MRGACGSVACRALTTVSVSHTRLQCRLARVTATFMRRLSARNPTSPWVLDRTMEMTMASFSRPWGTEDARHQKGADVTTGRGRKRVGCELMTVESPSMTQLPTRHPDPPGSRRPC